MKRFFICLSAGLILILGNHHSFAQTTATDFTADDCSGISHHLFSELDAGKVVVISFVMPCATCIGPSLSTRSVVQGFSSSYPGRVVFYLIDDAANTDCSTLKGWAAANGMGSVTCLSNSSVIEANYGPGGMPKIVVVGGSDHKIYFVQNGGVNTANLTASINSALLATGINEEPIADFQLTVYSPLSGKLSARYMLKERSEVYFEIFNIQGIRVKATLPVFQTSGDHETQLGIDGMNSGMYFLKMSAGEAVQLKKFMLTN